MRKTILLSALFIAAISISNAQTNKVAAANKEKKEDPHGLRNAQPEKIRVHRVGKHPGQFAWNGVAHGWIKFRDAVAIRQPGMWMVGNNPYSNWINVIAITA